LRARVMISSIGSGWSAWERMAWTKAMLDLGGGEA
jgi:hypothetical protein